MPEAEIDLVNESAGGPDSLAPGVAATPDTAPAGRVRWLEDPAHQAPALRALKPPRIRAIPRAGRMAAMGLAFWAGVAGVLALFVAVAIGISAANADRVLPGIHVGAVDVSGLSRGEAVDRLRSAYSYLAQGELEITTPTGSTSVPYAVVGRTPNVEAMADAALRAGRTGNVLGDAITTWRSAIVGQELPLVIRIDPQAVSANVRQLTLTSRLSPRDAEAALFYDTFVYWPSQQGSVVDEDTVGQAIIRHLTEPNAPTRFQVGSALITLQPRVGDEEAQRAIEVAESMTVDVTLTLGPDATPSAAPSSSTTPAPSRTWVIPASAIRPWIVFEEDEAGTYGPRLDRSLMEAYIGSLPGTVITPAVEPRVLFDEKGIPASLVGGQDGLGVDVKATAEAVEGYLLSLARGGSSQSSLAVAVGLIHPHVNVNTVSGLTILGGGDAAWTTYYVNGENNGDGVNIRIPAETLNGQIVPPGAQFSFLKGVGPIDQAHGYTWGGVIVHGKSNNTGAIGGGICSASTTVFNAALRAGLQIDERHAHAYYIARYPAGLDATVYAGGSRVSDLKWTNDTPYPIVIRSWATNRGAKSSITVQLWSLPLDREVILDYPPKKENIVKAGDSTVYVTTLAPGEKKRAEYPTDGYDIVRTRTVYDEDGTLLHANTWRSHYTKVDGILQIGAGAPTPPPTPAPTAVLVVPALALYRALAGTRRSLRT